MCAIFANEGAKCFGAAENFLLQTAPVVTLGDEVAEIGDNFRTLDLGTATNQIVELSGRLDSACALLQDRQ
eukprot:3936281-Rhodomonas_salina.1